MHRLTSSFILGYHGCDRDVGERLLRGTPFKPSDNDYDWLGPGVYFWEANPRRGFEFAQEASRRKGSGISKPFVIGAVIESGLCLDLTTSSGVDWIRIAFENLAQGTAAAGLTLPTNSEDQLKRNLDCAVVRRLHTILDHQKLPPVDTLKGIFTEGSPAWRIRRPDTKKLTPRSPSEIFDASKAFSACRRINCTDSALFV